MEPAPDPAHDLLPKPFRDWFASRGWEPRAHQLELLRKARAGRSALLVAPTGAGKTLAGFLPTLVDLAMPVIPGRSAAGAQGKGTQRRVVQENVDDLQAATAGSPSLASLAGDDTGQLAQP